MSGSATLRIKQLGAITRGARCIPLCGVGHGERQSVGRDLQNEGAQLTSAARRVVAGR
jgi:hypothetical protein